MVKRLSPPMGEMPMVRSGARSRAEEALEHRPGGEGADHVSRGQRSRTSPPGRTGWRVSPVGCREQKEGDTDQGPPTTEAIVAMLIASRPLPAWPSGARRRSSRDRGRRAGRIDKDRREGAAIDRAHIDGAERHEASRASSVKVNGSISASAMVAVRPGSAPTKRPAVTPRKTSRSMCGARIDCAAAEYSILPHLEPTGADVPPRAPRGGGGTGGSVPFEIGPVLGLQPVKQGDGVIARECRSFGSPSGSGVRPACR